MYACSQTNAAVRLCAGGAQHAAAPDRGVLPVQVARGVAAGDAGVVYGTPRQAASARRHARSAPRAQSRHPRPQRLATRAPLREAAGAQDGACRVGGARCWCCSPSCCVCPSRCHDALLAVGAVEAGGAQAPRETHLVDRRAVRHSRSHKVPMRHEAHARAPVRRRCLLQRFNICPPYVKLMSNFGKPYNTRSCC